MAFLIHEQYLFKSSDINVHTQEWKQ